MRVLYSHWLSAISHRLNDMDLDNDKSIRVLIVDDRPPARAGLRALLASIGPVSAEAGPLQPNQAIEVIGEASCGEEAIEMVARCRPNVVLMDARMPGMDGISATRQIKTRWPEVRVLILTMYATHRQEAMEAGADAYLLKGCPPDELIRGILCDDPDDPGAIKENHNQMP